MNIVSIRIITADVARLAAFYEVVTGTRATWATDDFAEIALPAFTIALGSTRTAEIYGAGVARPGENHGVFLEFLVDDVDAEYARLRSTDLGVPFVTEPADMPWGNRSVILRDPDGTLVNLFTPVTDRAKAKYADRFLTHGAGQDR